MKCCIVRSFQVCAFCDSVLVVESFLAIAIGYQMIFDTCYTRKNEARMMRVELHDF